MEGRGGHDLRHRLLTDTAEFDGPPVGQILKLIGAQVGQILQFRHEGDLPVLLPVKIFSRHRRCGKILLQRSGREIDVLPFPLHAVKAHGTDISRQLLNGGKGLFIGVHVAGIEPVHTVFPEVIPTAQQIAVNGVGKQQRFQRLQLCKDIQGIQNHVLLRVQLHLGGGAEQAKVGGIMEVHGTLILFIGFQVMQQHPVTSVGDGNIMIDRMVGIDAHTGEGVLMGGEEALDKHIVVCKALMDHIQILFHPEGEFQRIEAAVVGQGIPVAGLDHRIDVPLLITTTFLKPESFHKTVGQTVDHPEIHRFPLQIDDGQFKLHAGIQLSGPLYGANVLLINGFFKRPFVRHRNHSFSPDPRKNNRETAHPMRSPQKYPDHSINAAFRAYVRRWCAFFPASSYIRTSKFPAFAT